MLSRAADTVFWLSRYIERAENTARVIDVNIQLMPDLNVEAGSQWRPIVLTTGDEQAFVERYNDRFRQDEVLRFLIFDMENPNSILSCVRAARENVRGVRQSISSEMWETVRRAAGDRRLLDDPHDFLTEVKTFSHLFVGLTEGTMSHGEAWQWARLSRFMERADKTSRIVDVKYYFILPNIEYIGIPYDNLHWAALLRSATAFEMYRKHHPRIAPNAVAEFLLLNREFPRSIRYCVAQAQESLHAITGSPMGTFNSDAEQQLGRLRADLDFGRMEEILTYGLHEFLDDIQRRVNAAGADGHVALASGPDHTLAAPLSGTYRGTGASARLAYDITLSSGA